MGFSRITEPLWANVGRFLLKPIILAAAGMVMVFQSYMLMNPGEDSADLLRHTVAERACTRAAGDLPEKQGIASLAVLDLAGDHTGFITGQLREKIAATGRFQLLEESFFRKLMREFGKEQVRIARLAEAVTAARELGVDAVVFGTVPEYTSAGGGAALRLELRMAERESGQALFARSYAETIPGDRFKGAYWRARVANSPKGRRIFIWTVFTILLPLVTIPLIRRLTGMESNLANLFTLLGYTAVDMFVALLLTGFLIPTLWTAAVLLIALAASALYNYAIMGIVESMRH